MRPTSSLYFDERRKLSNGKFPLKLAVTVKRKTRYWNLGLSFSKQDYEKLRLQNHKEPYRTAWLKLNDHVTRADKLIEELMPFFNFDDFKDRFFDNSYGLVHADKSSLLALQDEICIVYQRRGQESMIGKIKDSVKSILKYCDKKDISIRRITPEFCLKYERYMVQKSVTGTRNGAGINLRHIRILFNYGIKQRVIPKEWYPFNDYTIPNERKVKKPLTREEITSLLEFDLFTSKAQERAHTAFFASFYFNGSNAADFLRFKYTDIQGDFIVFYRTKTINSRKYDLKPVKVFLTQEIRSFIKKHGSKPAEGNRHIFDILKPKMTVDEEREAITRFNRQASKSLKVICKNLGLTKNISMKNARHSLANLLKTANVNRDFIKDIFGHRSILTTEYYLEELEDDLQKDIMNRVTSLKKSKSA